MGRWHPLSALAPLRWKYIFTDDEFGKMQLNSQGEAELWLPVPRSMHPGKQMPVETGHQRRCRASNWPSALSPGKWFGEIWDFTPAAAIVLWEASCPFTPPVLSLFYPFRTWSRNKKKEILILPVQIIIIAVMIAQHSWHPVWFKVSAKPLYVGVGLGEESSMRLCRLKIPVAGRNLMHSEGNMLWLLWSTFMMSGINQLWKVWVSSNQRREGALSRMWEPLQTAAFLCGNSVPE